MLLSFFSQNNWRLPDTDMVRKAILYEAGRLYRNWRSRLHDYYLMFETKEEALKRVPDDVDASDWQFMVDYFSSPSFEVHSFILLYPPFCPVNFNKFPNMLFIDLQIMSTINKANRAKLRTNHTCGQKSYTAVSYDAVRFQFNSMSAYNLLHMAIFVHCLLSV